MVKFQILNCMKETKLTNKHFCFVIFLEMNPADFLKLLHSNSVGKDFIFLESKGNPELYQEAKEVLLNKNLGGVDFDFDYDAEPFVFNKYINGKLDRAYKICIFEQEEPVKSFSGKTSNEYCDGIPLFFDPTATMIKNSL